MPLRSRHGYAADLHHGLPTGDITQPRSSPHDLRAGAHRNPAQIRQVRAGGLLLRGVQPLVPHVHLPVLLAGPAPSGGAGTSRRCQDCFRPSRPSRRVRLPSASTSPLRRAGGGAFHHRTVQQRLVALDVPHPDPLGHPASLADLNVAESLHQDARERATSDFNQLGGVRRHVGPRPLPPVGRDRHHRRCE
jgi:hypothetical protein